MIFFDDQFPIHRKVTRLSDAAFRLHVSAIFWCGRNLTDGVVPEEDLEDVSAQVRTPTRFVPELLKRGVWHEAGEDCPSESCPAPAPQGTWAIHDYFDFQPTKEKAVKRRKDNAERQRRWRERQTESRSGNNGVSNASRNARLTKPSPVPSSPEGTRTDAGSQSSSRRTARAWADDDDSIDLGIVELLAELTGRQLSVLDAAQIRQRIVGRRQIEFRAAYVAAAIQNDPGKFLPGPEDPGPDEKDAPPLRVVPDWCGHCDPLDRTFELANGIVRCQECNPQARNPFTLKGGVLTDDQDRLAPPG